MERDQLHFKSRRHDHALVIANRLTQFGFAWSKSDRLFRPSGRRWVWRSGGATRKRRTKEAMIAALRSEPKFSELFMAYLLTRNSRVEEDLIDQLFNSSEKRLARLLLLAHFGKEGKAKRTTQTFET